MYSGVSLGHHSEAELSAHFDRQTDDKIPERHAEVLAAKVSAGDPQYQYALTYTRYMLGLTDSMPDERDLRYPSTTAARTRIQREIDALLGVE